MEGVIHRRGEDSQKSNEIYLVPIEGGLNPITLNKPLPAGSDIEDFQTSPATGRVVYRADQDTKDVIEL